MIKKRPKHQLLLKRRSSLIIIGIVLAIILALVAWIIMSNRDSETKKDGGPSSDPGNYVNLNPPTEQEIQDAENHKKDLTGQSQSQPPTDQNGKKLVVPIITNVQASQVNAYIPGIFEDGGTCTVTLIKGSQTVTRTSNGFKNVSYTSCEPISISPALERGSWSVVVKYVSSLSAGQSQPKDFTVN